MDIMIPFLGRITRLQLESKGAFHIAGVKDANVQRIELEKRQRREIERRKKAAESANKSADKKDKDIIEEDEDGNKHLDTWA
ncbi:putative phosphoribosyltransferase [Pseudoalteromonas sp. MBR-15]|jgi:predicted phosphoribosyltransferase